MDAKSQQVGVADEVAVPWQLPEHERPISSTVVWTRYFVVTMFGVLAIWGVADLSATTRAWLTALLLAIVGMFCVARRRQWRRLQARRAVAMDALHAGSVARAGVLLDGILLEVARFPALHAAVLADRALVDLRVGWLETAKGRLWAAMDSGWHADEGEDARLRGLVPARYSLCEALSGHIDAARAWSARARSALRGQDRCHLLALDLVLAAGTEELAATLEAVEADWGSAQRVLSTDDLRILGILIAFAREQLGGDPAETAAWFALLAPGEADFLGSASPEMREFIRGHVGAGSPHPTTDARPRVSDAEGEQALNREESHA